MAMSPMLKKSILEDMQKKNHPLISRRNLGVGRKPCGNIQFFLVFANDKTSTPWTNNAMRQYITDVNFFGKSSNA